MHSSSTATHKMECAHRSTAAMPCPGHSAGAAAGPARTHPPRRHPQSGLRWDKTCSEGPIHQTGSAIQGLQLSCRLLTSMRNVPEFSDLFLDSSQAPGKRIERSEEHTSELQSQSNLVCRLLLEK